MINGPATLLPVAPVTPAREGGRFSTSLTLPYPPSVNTYWRRNGGRYFIARAGKAFREAVINEANGCGCCLSRLRVTVDLFPPDRRRRDIDNVAKALLDALGHARIYGDDSQIDRLHLRRMEVSPPGFCTVLVEEIE
jgi:crossover junction endodeoxyribonuclease RusA